MRGMNEGDVRSDISSILMVGTEGKCLILGNLSASRTEFECEKVQHH